MAKQHDIYRDWLGVTETARPLNYYQLFRLKAFEDNLAAIRERYKKMNAHVRKFATGDFAAQSQELLNELARAMLCLTDAQRKREYDASLGRKDVGEGRRRSFEEILLANKVIDRDQLTKARNFANAVGLEIRDAVLQQKLATHEAVMLAYAESLGLPYVDLTEIGVDEQLVAKVPVSLCRQRSCVPVLSDASQVLMASPNPLVPDVEEELRLRLGVPVRSVICTKAQIDEAIAKYYPREAGGAAAPVPATAPAKRRPAASDDEPADEPPPRSAVEEAGRRHLMIAIMGFNITIVLAMVGQILIQGNRFGYLKGAAISVVLGMLVGGAAFFVAKKLRL